MFCNECMKRTRFGTTTRTQIVTIHGVDIPIECQASVCARCGTEAYDPEEEMAIFRKAKAIYRERMHMLSSNHIREYMFRNKLSPQQMANKVGCAVEEIIAARDDTLLDTAVDKKLKQAISA